MEGTRIELFGIEELQKFFDSLNSVEQAKIILDAYREGTKPAIVAIRGMLRSRLKTKSRTRNLEKSIGFVPGRIMRKSSQVSAKVGARRFGNYRGFHGHLFDAGTVERATKRGFNRGTMPATHFFTDTIEQQEASMMNAITDNVITAMDKHIQSKIKKQAK